MDEKGKYGGLLAGALDRLRDAYRGCVSFHASGAQQDFQSDMTVDSLTRSYHAEWDDARARGNKKPHTDPGVQQLEARLASQVIDEVDSSLMQTEGTGALVDFGSIFELSPTYKKTFCQFYEQPDLRVSQFLLSGLVDDPEGFSYKG